MQSEGFRNPIHESGASFSEKSVELFYPGEDLMVCR